MASPRFVAGLACAAALLAGCNVEPEPVGFGDGAAPVPVPATTVPASRTDENSAIAHAELLEKARSGTIDVYFIGDSITRRWGALDYPELLEHWNRTFFGWNAANFAWGGDRTENILWRLENGELDGVDPAVFVVQAGTNNLGGNDDAAGGEAVAAGIQAIVETATSHAPNAVILLTAVFPRSDRPELNPVIESVNRELAAYADGDRIRYVDINDRISDDSGVLLDTMSPDGLHLSLAAYEVWAGALTPHLREILGPSAAEDLAPPPTGNPAAR